METFLVNLMDIVFGTVSIFIDNKEQLLKKKAEVAKKQNRKLLQEFLRH